MKESIVLRGLAQQESACNEVKVLVEACNNEMGTWRESCHGIDDELDDLDA